MWYSARNSFSYPVRNYKANLGIKPSALNSEEQNAVNSYKVQGGKLGGTTTYGSVIALGDKYALKTMEFYASNASDNLKIFLNEVRVGGIPGIEKVGPRIYAWRITRNSKGDAAIGQYIMDSFTQGNKSVVSSSLHEYARNVLKVCPDKSHPVVKLLKETLELVIRFLA
jgi:hypothetical protein